MTPRRPAVLDWLDRRPFSWVLLGVALLVMSQVRAPVGALAWLAPVPWLRYVRSTRGWRSRLAFGIAFFAGWTLATTKIASEPMLLALAPLFALPITLSMLPAYVAWNHLHTRVPPLLAAAVYAVGLAAGEWALHTFTPFGSWGATAYSQIDDAPLLQAASVAGIAGVGAVVSLVAACMESALAGDEKSMPALCASIAIALVVHAAGTARLAVADVAAGPTVTVAAIETDSDVHGLPLPAREATYSWNRALLSRTESAARGGAVLAVWPEAATLVWPDEETAWLDSVRDVARASQIDVIAAYVVPTSIAPLAYRNEYRLVRKDGVVEPAYAKHHPVPGEPSIRGVGAAPVVARDWGRLSGAICYDYDFPAMGLERARLGADVVAVPAADWRAIDPVHAQMAALRAIESGSSMLRSTRSGLSIAVDPYGRTRAWRSAFEGGSGIMFAQLPRARVQTLYSVWGDTPLLAAAALLACLVAFRPLRPRDHDAVFESALAKRR